MKLQDIQSFYSKYYSSVFTKPTNVQDQQFLADWMLLFDISPEDENMASSDMLKFLSDRIWSTLEKKIVIIFNSNQDKKSEWKRDQKHFFRFLKEKKCINIRNETKFEQTQWVNLLNAP
jgi:hypothetical protein